MVHMSERSQHACSGARLLEKMVQAEGLERASEGERCIGRNASHGEGFSSKEREKDNGN
jgi:hypothetical protein